MTDTNQTIIFPVGAPMVVYLTAHAEMIGAAAKRLARSTMLPESLRLMPSDSAEDKERKIADVGVLFARCLNSGEDIIALGQQTYFVGGRASVGAAYVVARAQQLGLIKGAPRYQTSGTWPDITVSAAVVLASDGQTYAASVGMEEARADGWTGRNPKYKTATTAENMLRNRAVTRLIRQVAPGVLLGMGFPVTEEALDYVEMPQPAKVARIAAPVPAHLVAEPPALPDGGEYHEPTEGLTSAAERLPTDQGEE